MAVKMTITITEDDAPDGCVNVDHEVEGFDIETARQNSDLPPSLLMGGAMLQVVDAVPSGGGEPVPAKSATIDRMVQ
jgi:hypothetical protein